ncbi:MAG: caspase family protein [Acidobacteria bacterium]|nr:caspase family protein [Acidobacteriota bacterium]
MAQGISINIGLNNINPAHYTVDGILKGCENDAEFMAKLAESRNFQVRKLIGSAANTKNVVTAITDASGLLKAGDTMLITYSGHGGQIKDSNNNEGDGFDETWCLYDRQMIDDEMFELWTKFDEGVRILVISDSCHSGTVTGSIGLGFSDLKWFLKNEINFANCENKFLKLQGFNSIPVDEAVWEKDLQKLNERGIVIETYFGPRDKTLLKTVLNTVYEQNKENYDSIQKEVWKKLTLGQKKDFRELVKASVILISACQDWQTAKDGNENSLFTSALKDVWDNGGFDGNYIQLHEQIWRRIKDRQSPNYYKVGTPDSAFELQKAFTAIA